MDNDWAMDEHWKVIDAGGVVVSNTPEQLWENAVDYFKWCDHNPIKTKRTATSGKKEGTSYTVEYKRPYSIKGFCLHCGISERYIQDIQTTNAKDSMWYRVIEKIMMIIYTDNLEGAVVDLYNPIMVSKLLGLDKPQDSTDAPVKVTIVDARSSSLANSENEVLQKLDFGKVEILKDKVENS